jgi:general secretion pathway protein D
MRKILFSLTILLVFFWCCSTFSNSYKLGTEEAINKNWDEAVKHFERAVYENPKNSVYRLALLRAKVYASYAHLLQARSLASEGKKNEALKEYGVALSYDPSNRTIAEEAKILTEKKGEKKPEGGEMVPPVMLDVSDEKITLNFLSDQVLLRSIFQALGKHAGINILFDDQFSDKPFSVDLTDMSFEQAVSALCLASKNFYRVIDRKTLIIVPDLPAKRMQYELNAIRTFYVSNINAVDIHTSLLQLLRTQFKAPSIMVDKNLNSITIRDNPEVIKLAEKLIKLWDKPKGEVIIDLEIMEVRRVKLRDFGLDFDQHIVGMRYGGGGESEGWFNLSDVDLSKTENYQITFPTAFLQFLETDSDTKLIAQPRLRGIDGEKISYMVGDEVPIPRTTFTPIAAGGVSQQPVTSFEYKNVGIELTITPRIHFENEITMELEFKINALGGAGYADLPIITTRDIKNIIRLKDGETSLLAGLLKDEERMQTKGIIGLKSIPVLGSLFSRTDQTIEQTDVVLTITPHIIRTIPFTDEDREPIWVNLQGLPPTSGAPQVGMMDVELGHEAAEERRQRREEEQKNQIFLNPANFQVQKDREFRISIGLRTGEEVGNMSLSLSFNPRVITLKQVVKGSVITQMGRELPFLQNIDNAAGACTIGFSSPDPSRGFKGSGTIATLVFESTASGESTISVSSITANGPTGRAVSFETRESRMIVR